MRQDICDIINSEDYIDLIVHGEPLDEPCVQQISDDYYVKYIRKPGTRLSVSEYGYEAVPKVFGLCDTTSIEEIGAVKLKNNKLLSFTGKNVIVGIVDTGIDYSHEAFMGNDGRSRILGAWEQNVSGNPPEGFAYGSFYNRDMIETFAKEEAFRTYETGHGTFLAGVASTRETDTNGPPIS